MHPAHTMQQLRAAQTDFADQSCKGHGVVVTYSPTDPDHARSHEGITRAAIGRTLAAVKGWDFAGEYDPSRCYPGRTYLVPGDTLVGVEAACELCVRSAVDLLGGVVPFSL